MKKILLLVFLLPVYLLIFSCSQKKSAVVENPEAKEFAYQLFYYDLCGNFQEAKYNKLSKKNPLPSDLRKLLHTKIICEGRFCYLIEFLYPQCKGLIDSYGYYLPENDNGRWVDKIVFQVQEELIGDDITSLLENNSSVQDLMDFADEENAAEEKTVEKYLLAAENRLKAMSYDKEIFVPYRDGQQNRIIHSDSDKKNVSRIFYDENFRLIKKEEWYIPNYNDAKKNQTEEFIYENKDSVYPSQTLLLTENEKTVSYYNDKGQILKSDNFLLEDSKFVKKYTMFWNLDEQGRIISERKVDYKANSEESDFEKKQKFIYNKENEEIPPDYEYYEDGTIKSKTVYTDRNNYVTTVYFEKDYKVTSYYTEGKKIKDVYTVGESILRVKNYE